MVSNRFAARWRVWDAHVHEREEATTFLSEAKDEDLLELLASSTDRDRKYERDIIAVELENRLAARNKGLPHGADGVQRAAALAHEAALRAQKALHTAEAILKAHGDVELGADVSASALINLDTTKLAKEAADAHALEVQAALMKSRAAEHAVERLAQDAADAARETTEKVAKGAARVASLGHEDAAEQAREAAQRIREAAEEVARKLGEGQ